MFFVRGISSRTRPANYQFYCGREHTQRESPASPASPSCAVLSPVVIRPNINYTLNTRAHAHRHATHCELALNWRANCTRITISARLRWHRFHAYTRAPMQICALGGGAQQDINVGFVGADWRATQSGETEKKTKTKTNTAWSVWHSTVVGERGTGRK